MLIPCKKWEGRLKAVAWSNVTDHIGDFGWIARGLLLLEHIFAKLGFVWSLSYEEED